MRPAMRRWSAATARPWRRRGPPPQRWRGHDDPGNSGAGPFAPCHTRRPGSGRAAATPGVAPKRDDLDAAAAGRAVLARHLPPGHRPATVVDGAWHEHAVARDV